MQIKLIQSGGLTGTKMAATVACKLSENDWYTLVKAVSKKPGVNNKAKDGFSYTLQKNEDDTSKTAIDIQAIPEVHNELFEKIFNKLKPVK